MKTILKPVDLGNLQQRIASLTSTSEHRWRAMSVRQMLCHTTDQFRLALGHKPATQTATWFNRTIAIW